MTTEIPYAAAVVQQASVSHAPVLSAGCITIATIRAFKNACCQFFQHRSITEVDCVSSIIYNFEGSGIQSWVNANNAHLSALTFPQFLPEFKKKFLPQNWQDKLVAMQIGVQGMTPFLSWTERVQEANAELGIAKSNYHIEEDKLHAHFVPRLSPRLKFSYDASNTHLDLNKIMDMYVWVECVHLLHLELSNK